MRTTLNTSARTQSLALALAPKIIQWRRTIHAYPELGFQEFETAKLVARELTALGIEFRTGVGKTGIVAEINNPSGTPGKRIALRADMDALPIHEDAANARDYRSQVDGVMHACGHDAHTAMLLGAASIFAQYPPKQGGVRFLFQPCEEDNDDEGLSGAQRMQAEGAMDDVDAVIALHVTPFLPCGVVGYDNAISASVDDFECVLRGPGGHAAYPNVTVDTVMILGQVIHAIYAAVPRAIDPLHQAVLTIGAVNGGTAYNVIPDRIVLKGTLRTRQAKAREDAMRSIERVLAVAQALGAQAEWRWLLPAHPLALNHPATLAAMLEASRDVLGQGQHCVSNEPQLGLGGEDFTYFAQSAPGAMVYLGTRLAGHGEWHTPTFDVDEQALPLGTAILVESARRLMN